MSLRELPGVHRSYLWFLGFSENRLVTFFLKLDNLPVFGEIWSGVDIVWIGGTDGRTGVLLSRGVLKENASGNTATGMRGVCIGGSGFVPQLWCERSLGAVL